MMFIIIMRILFLFFEILSKEIFFSFVNIIIIIVIRNVNSILYMVQ